MHHELYKYLTGAVWLTNTNDLFKITDVNKELMAMSVYNKGITIEFIRGTMAECMVDFGWKELHVSIQFFEDREARYIGDNDQVAQVLYGNNLTAAIKAKT